MIHLGKNIERIAFIDIFNEEERLKKAECVVTQPLKGYVDSLNIQNLVTSIDFPAVNSELETILTDLAREQGSGIIIQLCGHGDGSNRAFGNNAGLYMGWLDAISYFEAIHHSWNHSLIVNASIMCYSSSLIDSVKPLTTWPYHASITSSEKNSLQGLNHNKFWYQRNLGRDRVKESIVNSNNQLDISQDKKPYHLHLNGRVYN